jgi:hypothetical protein
MYKVNLKWNIKDLDGTEIPNTEAGKFAAQMVASANEGNSIKLIDWALTLYKTATIELDSTELEVLKVIVEADKKHGVLVRGQIGKYLMNVKDSPTTAKK